MESFGKAFAKTSIRMLSTFWQPYSRLILGKENSGWVLDWEMLALQKIAKTLGIRTLPGIWMHGKRPQAIFFASQFFLTDDDSWLDMPHRIGFSYYHGLPQTGSEEFDRVYEAVCRHHERLSRIQVSHSQMRDAVLQTGIEPSKVKLIPIGINVSYFSYRDIELRNQQRIQLEIPDNAFVVGSFQKDGNGWDEGAEPKLIKGPDTFVETIEQLKATIPNLFVLLVGPARGYVKNGLNHLGIPYRDMGWLPYPETGRLFSALDLYLVTSRQEGGPKAILESMASGVPLVTTRVGQAMDLVIHGENGWIVDVEDVDGLSRWGNYVYGNRGAELDKVLINGRATAEANSYDAQLSLWRDFMKGFVEWKD